MDIAVNSFVSSSYPFFGELVFRYGKPDTGVYSIESAATALGMPRFFCGFCWDFTPNVWEGHRARCSTFWCRVHQLNAELELGYTEWRVAKAWHRRQECANE